MNYLPRLKDEAILYDAISSDFKLNVIEKNVERYRRWGPVFI